MVGVTPRLGPAELAAALAALEVRVDSAQVERSAVPLPDYPGGPRPSSVVRLTGNGACGLGENVAFFESEHERFQVFVERWLQTRGKQARVRVGTALGAEGTPYERAALEAALIDLGLRQAGLSLCDLTGVQCAQLRFVVSLAAHPEPQFLIERLRADGFAGDLKLDVDPAWAPRTLDIVARDARIAIFDFKSRGSAELARTLGSLNRQALFEDPPSGFEDPDREAHPTRISRDASLNDENAVAAARARGEAVNLKAPRMGGPLTLLRALELARATSRVGAPRPAYVGGMFEVGAGRSQARQLAALYCGTAPNDLALNAPHRASPERTVGASPAVVRLDEPGFGND
jgi:L-alanine-DL-glutamate epimerase-like enolase superfamily enzyme